MLNGPLLERCCALATSRSTPTQYQRVSWAARAPGGCETHSRARRYRSSSCCRAAGPCEGQLIERCARGGLSWSARSSASLSASRTSSDARRKAAMPIQPTRTCEQRSWDECGGRALQVPSHDRHSAPTVRVEAGSRARKAGLSRLRTGCRCCEGRTSKISRSALGPRSRLPLEPQLSTL